MGIKNVLSIIGRGVREIAYPNDIKCIVCDGELSADNIYGVCLRCKLERNLSYCLACGRAIDSLATFCNDCATIDRAFESSRAPVVVSGGVHKVVHALKYGGAKWLVPYIVEYMLDCVSLEYGWEYDVIVPVPLHPKRQRERGYNQSELLAAELGRRLKVECRGSVIERIKHTEYLARMSRLERAAAIEGAFEVLDQAAIRGKRILLVDDVFTTGATVSECAKTLKKNRGANRVYVLTFATGRISVPLV